MGWNNVRRKSEKKILEHVLVPVRPPYYTLLILSMPIYSGLSLSNVSNVEVQTARASMPNLGSGLHVTCN